MGASDIYLDNVSCDVSVSTYSKLSFVHETEIESLFLEHFLLMIFKSVSLIPTTECRLTQDSANKVSDN